ncbi:hypothetical protein [Aeromicrobium sp.]|uniref:hypothetical protein n=1 Tax=Aeromicrobium sp. TaxID=1871063 RepID=UPI0028A69A69|nr:hypothetical protein [Aeromicrobium sp.]
MTAVTRRWIAATLVAAVALALAAAVVFTRTSGAEPYEAGPQPTLPVPTRPSASPTPEPEPDPCLGGADRPFTPDTISFRDEVYPVMKLPRDALGVPGTPPLTQEGKWTFGWDGPPSPLPGARRGHVIVNAHTYPDGSALGNLFLDHLRDGDVLVARGEDQVQCYRVGRRFEVHAESRDSGYENPEGPARLAILACSGTRTGPGDWSHRTIWFAKAIDVSPPASA